MKCYEDYIHKSKYARYLPEEHRRETWKETCSRYVAFMSTKTGDKISPRKWSQLENAINRHEIMPSMRALMTAGPALERDNVAGYNCAYVPVDDRRVFDEIMYILMCGTGVGFSVERRYIERLPIVAEEFFDDGTTTIHVADSRIGWATAYRKLVTLLYDGLIPTMDYSNIRPEGERLKIFGGRASGPGPFKNLSEYTINLFQHAKGRRLNELECHDLICKIAEVIVCGGVRRSALISLSNVTSDRLRNAKTGQWYVADAHRALANNSSVYTERPDLGMFLKEWTSLIQSKSGERGIFSRYACDRSLPDRRESGYEWGCNPCSEIVLRPRQFCNLTEVVARPEDTKEDLKRKIELATILGTVQSTLTDFKYLGKKWKDNCEEERLLGVSITGIMDCPLLHTWNEGSGELKDLLEELRDHAITTNKKWAKVLGVRPSAAITCVKPSGTVSQLVGSSSGIHPRFSRHYIRRVRNDIKDPVSQALVDAGVPYAVDVTNPNQYVFEFPIKSPSKCVTVDDLSALRQLELWQLYDAHWCEHKPSVSIYVREDEWLSVGDWVYKHFDTISGISFFPHEDNVYKQAPYEKITKEEYNYRMDGFPIEINFDFKEDEDITTSSQELACQGGQCEL